MKLQQHCDSFMSPYVVTKQGFVMRRIKKLKKFEQNPNNVSFHDLTWRSNMIKDLKYYMSLTYPVILSEIKDAGEHIFSAVIEDLPGLEVYAYSVEELLRELEEAKESWIATALELNRPIKEPRDSFKEYSGRTTIRMSKSLHKRLADLTERESISLNALINQLLERSTSNDCIHQILVPEH